MKNQPISEEERALFLQFLTLKALKMNMETGGTITGLFGFAFGHSIGSILAVAASPFIESNNADQIHRTVAEASIALTTLPGKAIGFVTSPIRIAVVHGTRNLMHSSARVRTFATELSEKLPELKLYEYGRKDPKILSNFDNINNIIQKIIQVYGTPGSFMGGSSDELVYHLIGHTRTWYHEGSDSIKTCHFGEAVQTITEKTQKLINYLLQQEQVGWGSNSLTFFQNQGKHLLNIIMTTLEEQGQFLLKSKENEATPPTRAANA